MSSPSAGLGERLLARAADGLRRHQDERWDEVSGRVLARLRSIPLRRESVRGIAPSGPFDVSESVVVSHVSASVEAAVPEAVVVAVRLAVTARRALAGVVVEVAVDFASPVGPLADRIRATVLAVLPDVLGAAAGPEAPVPVEVRVVDIVDRATTA